MNEVILHHHLGLGDHFICNGLVNYISNESKIYLICKESYSETINSLYSDNFNVNPIFLYDDSYQGEFDQVNQIQNILKKDILRIGFHNIDHSRFDRIFYDRISLPFEYRYSMFKLPRVNQTSIKLFQSLSHGQEYALVHRQSSEGSYNINITSNLKIIDIDFTVTRNMLNWVDMIKNASEIHCVPSSFFCLVDSMSTQLRGDLFYHDIRKGTLINPNNEYNKNVWKIVTYDTKL
jgi:hypothetical protein